MGILGGLLKSAVDIVSLPVAVVLDVVTLGNAEATGNTVEKLADDLDEAGEGVANGDIL